MWNSIFLFPKAVMLAFVFPHTSACFMREKTNFPFCAILTTLKLQHLFCQHASKQKALRKKCFLFWKWSAPAVHEKWSRASPYEASLRLTELLMCASLHGTADFVSKMQIVLKEANETGYWLELLYKTNYIGEEQYNFLESKCKSLRAMLVSSINTAKNNNK